jgi:hypothetical protein
MTLALAAATTAAGCDASGPYDGYGRGGYYDPCTQFQSCAQCTPIIGCGWCSYGKGQGICLAAPNECRTAQFSWTWDPSGCASVVTPADAGAVSGQPDAAPDGATTDDGGAAADASTD